jgi:TonB family protein
LREQSAKCAVKILKHPEPKFPDNIVQPGESYLGRPVLRVTIEENGDMSHVQLASSSGVHRLDTLLLTDILQWKYAPRPGCGIIEANVVVNVDWVAADSGASHH